MASVVVGQRGRWQSAALFLCLLCLSLVWLLPFVTVVLSSVRGQGDLLARGIFSWPSDFRWGNFGKAWQTGGFSTYFGNSLLIILIKVPLGIVISALAAFPLAKMRFHGDIALFVIFLLGIAVPVQVTLQPLLVMMKHLGIAGSLFALIPPYVAFGLPFQIFVLRGFFRQIPTELLESARIDGASELRVFRTIMLPLSLPALAALAIIDMLSTWNEFIIALVLISNHDSRTVPVGLLQFQGEYSTQYTLLMAGIVISIVPVLAIFLILQRYFIGGLTAGAVKG